jgi:hypothetical protein
LGLSRCGEKNRISFLKKSDFFKKGAEHGKVKKKISLKFFTVKE